MTMTLPQGDLNSQRIPGEWLLYHPVSGDEQTVPNDRTLASICKRVYWLDRGYVLDDNVSLELDEDGDNGQ